jgi:hypothetical protein
MRTEWHDRVQLAGGTKMDRKERAFGGSVIGGETVLVGERGPEFIMPRSDGWVMSNRDSKKAFARQAEQVSNTNYFYFQDTTLTEDELERVMGRLAWQHG